MINFFVVQIKLGKVTIEQVPEIFRKEVEAKLKESGEDNE